MANQEIEAKYAPAPGVSLEGWLPPANPAYRLGEEALILTEDRYLDSRDHGLLRAGFSLRVRHREGREPQLTLKSLLAGAGAILTRTETEVTLPAEDVDALSRWPASIRDVVYEALGAGRRLQVRSVLSQHRRKRLVFGPGPEAVPLAEFSLDRVQVFAGPGSQGPVAQFDEVEVESLGEGEDRGFGDLVGWIGAQPELVPVAGSKYERGMGLLWHLDPGDRPLTFRADLPMAEACRTIWRQELLQMLWQEAGVRHSEDIEYVHRMRVATRRARTAHRVFGAYFKPRAVKPYVKGLRKTAGLLGAVRDLDVALAALETYVDARPARRRDEAGPLVEHWAEARRKAFEELIAWLTGPKYREFVVGFDAFCHRAGAGARTFRPEPTLGPVPHQVRHVMPSRILAQYEAVRAYESLFDGEEPISAETYHALRIDAKRLRYGLEFVAPLLGEEGAAAVRQLKKMQDHLGEMNDADVQRVRLDAAMKAGVDTPFLDRYRKYLGKSFRKLAQDFPALWRSFADADNRKMLFRALARL